MRRTLRDRVAAGVLVFICVVIALLLSYNIGNNNGPILSISSSSSSSSPSSASPSTSSPSEEEEDERCDTTHPTPPPLVFNHITAIESSLVPLTTTTDAASTAATGAEVLPSAAKLAQKTGSASVLGGVPEAASLLDNLRECPWIRRDGACATPCTLAHRVIGEQKQQTANTNNNNFIEMVPVVTEDFPCFDLCRCPAPECVAVDDERPNKRQTSSAADLENNRTTRQRCVLSPFLVRSSGALSSNEKQQQQQQQLEDEMYCSPSGKFSDPIPEWVPTPRTSNITKEDWLPVPLTASSSSSSSSSSSQSSSVSAPLVPSPAAVRVARAQLQRFKRATSWAFRRWFDWGERVPYGGKRRRNDETGTTSGGSETTTSTSSSSSSSSARDQDREGDENLPRFVTPPYPAIATASHSLHDGIYRMKNVCVRSEGVGLWGFDPQVEKFRGVSELDMLARASAKSMQSYVHKVNVLSEPPAAVLRMRVLLFPVEWKGGHPGHAWMRVLAARRMAFKLWGGKKKKKKKKDENGNNKSSSSSPDSSSSSLADDFTDFHVIYVVNPYSSELSPLEGFKPFYQLLSKSWSVVYSDTPRDAAMRTSHVAQRRWRDFFGSENMSADAALAHEEELVLLRHSRSPLSASSASMKKRKQSSDPAAAAGDDGSSARDEDDDGEGNVNSTIATAAAAAAATTAEHQRVDTSRSDEKTQQQHRRRHNPFNDYTIDELHGDFSSVIRMKYVSERSHRTRRELKYEWKVPSVCFEEMAVAHVCDSSCSRRELPGNKYFVPYVALTRTQKDAIALHRFRRALGQCVAVSEGITTTTTSPSTVGADAATTTTMVMTQKKMRRKRKSKRMKPTVLRAAIEDPFRPIVTLLARTTSRIDLGLATAVPRIIAALQQVSAPISSARVQVVAQSQLSPSRFFRALAESSIVIGTLGGSLIFSFLAPPGAAVVEISGVKSCAYGAMGWAEEHRASDCEFAGNALAAGHSHLAISLPKLSTVGAWRSAAAQQAGAEAGEEAEDVVASTANLNDDDARSTGGKSLRMKAYSGTLVGSSVYAEAAKAAYCRVVLDSVHSKLERVNNNSSTEAADGDDGAKLLMKNPIELEVFRRCQLMKKFNVSAIEFREWFAGADS